MFCFVSFALLLPLFTAEEKEHPVVTYGSTIKLINIHSKNRLHSHEIPYGQGSCQQSVTGFPKGDDPNSLWFLKAAHGQHIKRGTPVNCSDIIRLEHLKTRKNLHSHEFASPVSKQQEVSAFGTNGEGDDGDNWKVICEPNKHKDEIWRRGVPIMLQHVKTGRYLFGHMKNVFDGPIQGQHEITAFDTFDDPENKWKTAEGIYVKPQSEED